MRLNRTQSDHPRHLTIAELTTLAAQGYVPADRNASDDELVDAVVSGVKPTALISVWVEANSDFEPLAVTRARNAGLMVWRNFEGIVADGVVFNYAISRDAESLERLLRAFMMPWSVVERQKQLGRALGYTWADIHAFIHRTYGSYPSRPRRILLALKGSVMAWRWARRAGVSTGQWVLVASPG